MVEVEVEVDEGKDEDEENQGEGEEGGERGGRARMSLRSDAQGPCAWSERGF